MRKRLFSLLVCFICLLTICSCGGGGGGNGDGEKIIISPFNGTFVGEIAVESEEKTVETIRLSLKANSPLTGTFYNRSNGDIGTISGEVDGNLATFTGSIDGDDGDCPTSYDGTIALVDNGSVLLEMEGTHCDDGYFFSSGKLNRKQCIDLSGTWCFTEDVEVTCNDGGEIDSWDKSESDLVVINQSKDSCSIGYSIDAPDYDLTVSRSGMINGNSMNLSGKFMFVLYSDVNVSFSENYIDIEGDIIDENNIFLSGFGAASGAYDGIEFSCTGDTTATLKRRYDLVVAIVRGGSSSFGSMDDFFEGNRWLEAIRQQCESDNRVIAKVFSSGSSSLDVERWLLKVDVDNMCGYDGDGAIPAILIGHSWGASTVLDVRYYDVYSRILLDYWDYSEWHGLSDETVFNQRDLEPKVVVFQENMFSDEVSGRVINYLAESPSEILGLYSLLGRRLEENDDMKNIGPIEGTTHTSIVRAVAEMGVIEDEINGCLDN